MSQNYTLEEVKTQASGPISLDPVYCTLAGIPFCVLGFFRTNCRGQEFLFAYVYRHPCGEIVVATPPEACVTVKTMVLVMSLMTPHMLDGALVYFDALIRGYVPRKGEELP